MQVVVYQFQPEFNYNCKFTLQLLQSRVYIKKSILFLIFFKTTMTTSGVVLIGTLKQCVLHLIFIILTEVGREYWGIFLCCIFLDQRFIICYCYCESF